MRFWEAPGRFREAPGRLLEIVGGSRRVQKPPESQKSEKSKENRGSKCPKKGPQRGATLSGAPTPQRDEGVGGRVGERGTTICSYVVM